MRPFNCYLLVPAMHSADRVGVDRKCYVLMNTAVGPENSRSVWVIAFVGADTFDNTHFPFTRFGLVDRDLIRRPTVVLCVLFATPSADVVRTRHDTRTHSFRHPCAIYKVTDLGRDAHKITGFDPPKSSI